MDEGWAPVNIMYCQYHYTGRTTTLAGGSSSFSSVLTIYIPVRPAMTSHNATRTKPSKCAVPGGCTNRRAKRRERGAGHEHDGRSHFNHWGSFLYHHTLCPLFVIYSQSIYHIIPPNCLRNMAENNVLCSSREANSRKYGPLAGHLQRDPPGAPQARPSRPGGADLAHQVGWL